MKIYFNYILVRIHKCPHNITPISTYADITFKKRINNHVSRIFGLVKDLYEGAVSLVRECGIISSTNCIIITIFFSTHFASDVATLHTRQLLRYRISNTTKPSHLICLFIQFYAHIQQDAISSNYTHIQGKGLYK